MDNYLKDAGAYSIQEIKPIDDFDGYVKIYKFLYSSDGNEVVGYVAIPECYEQPLPILIYNRGGNRDFGMLNCDVLCRYAIRGGYIVFGSQYRGNDGGTGCEDFGGNDVDDVIKLIDLSLKLPNVKKDGVYMVGHSRGGMMTYRACSIDNRIKAAAVGSGLADCRIMYYSREDSMKKVFLELVGGTPEELPDAYSIRSAVDWADKIIPPIFIGQGTIDWRVIPEQPRKLVENLKKYNKIYEYKEYFGAEHSLIGTSYMSDVIEFLKKH